jgi:hypothetical protein
LKTRLTKNNSTSNIIIFPSIKRQIIEIKTIEVKSSQTEVSLCYSRCKVCTLFPYDKLAGANITKVAGDRTFDINSERQKISSSGFRLLCALTRQSGNILSKEYLIKYAWPESTLVGNNLNVSIYDLRILFRDSSIVIKNHRKEGYCLTV